MPCMDGGGKPPLMCNGNVAQAQTRCKTKARFHAWKILPPRHEDGTGRSWPPENRLITKGVQLISILFANDNYHY